MSTKQVALVTGGNRGIGLATAIELAKKGYRVVVTGRDQNKLNQAIASAVKSGLEIDPVQADITNDSEVKKLREYLEKKYSVIDVLVNNAGVFLESMDSEVSSGLTSSLDTIRKSFEINTLGAVRISQALIPLMKKSKAPRIVNVSSGMGALTDMNGSYPGYRLSKTALNAWTRILHDELSDQGFKINSVCPGWVKTDMGGPDAERSIEEGIAGVVWAATLSSTGPSGGFFRDGEKIDW